MNKGPKPNETIFIPVVIGMYFEYFYFGTLI